MNALVPVQGGMPVGTQQGNWVWDGTNWVCMPCDGSVPPFPFCPPPGFPPHGCPPWFSGMNSPPWYPGANAGVSFGNTAPMNAVRGHFWWNGMSLAIFDGAVWVNTSTGQIVPPNGGGGGVTPPPSPPGSVVISTTAPGNPFTGMQWWDGSTLRMWDGVKWNIIGPGAAAGPVPTTTNVFRIGLPTPLSIAPNTYAIVPFTATPTIDTLLGWNATTHQFKPTKAGMYQFFIQAQVSTGGSAGAMVLAKNDQGAYDTANTDAVAIWDLIGAAGGGIFMTSGMSLMNGTTDFVRLFAWSGAGTISGIGALWTINGFLMP